MAMCDFSDFQLTLWDASSMFQKPRQERSIILQLSTWCSNVSSLFLPLYIFLCNCYFFLLNKYSKLRSGARSVTPDDAVCLCVVKWALAVIWDSFVLTLSDWMVVNISIALRRRLTTRSLLALLVCLVSISSNQLIHFNNWPNSTILTSQLTTSRFNQPPPSPHTLSSLRPSPLLPCPLRAALPPLFRLIHYRSRLIYLP
jgi:hypothetical protein